MQLTILLSTLNEEKSGYLPLIINQLNELQSSDIEIVVVDGGSKDATIDLLEASSIKILHTKIKTRAGRYNYGFKHTTGNCVLFHHPRIVIQSHAIRRLLSLPSEVSWGGFTHKFDHKHPLLAWTSFYSNVIRFDGTKIAYLDHGLFANRALFAREYPFKDIEIFEDTEICEYLRKQAKPTRFKEHAIVSAIRFSHNGILKQMLMNQLLKIAYHLDLPAWWMNFIYEKGLGLNGQQEKKNKNNPGA